MSSCALMVFLSSSSSSFQATPPPVLPPFSELVKFLVHLVEPWFAHIIKQCPNIDELVAPALRSQEVKFGDNSPHSQAFGQAEPPSYAAYIASGLLLNAKGLGEGIPILSPLILRVILDDTNKKWDLAEPIRALLTLDDSAWPDSYRYERFHAHWEQLWRELHLMEGKYVLSTLLNSPIPSIVLSIFLFSLSCLSLSLSLARWVPRKEMSLLEFYRLSKENVKPFIDVKFNLVKKTIDQLKEGGDNRSEAAPTSILWIMPAGTPGYDISTFETTEKGQLGISLECKFETTGRLKDGRLRGMTQHKYDVWTKNQAQKSHEGASSNGLVAHNVVGAPHCSCSCSCSCSALLSLALTPVTANVAEKRLIVAAFWSTKAQNEKENEAVNGATKAADCHKEDMLVLVRTQLESLYSPSLATHPQFLIGQVVDRHVLSSIKVAGN